MQAPLAGAMLWLAPPWAVAKSTMLSSVCWEHRAGGGGTGAAGEERAEPCSRDALPTAGWMRSWHTALLGPGNFPFTPFQFGQVAKDQAVHDRKAVHVEMCTQKEAMALAIIFPKSFKFCHKSLLAKI